MAYQPTVVGTRYMVSAGHYLATQAAFDILEAGGNAVDAGVAANIALGVLQSDMVNVAGVAPILIYRAGRDDVLTITGLGPWPKAVDLDTYVQDHGGEIPLGIQRTVVPAAPDANITALERFGTMSFGEVAAAAIRYARDGFPMHPMMTAYITHHEATYSQWADNKAIYLPNGRPPQPGENFVQTDLARSLQHMADEEAAAARNGREAGLQAARDSFYRGDIAQAILRFHQENDGLLRAEDLAEFRSSIEPPVKKTFRGLGEPIDIYTCGPWCQGPVLLQMMALLDSIDLAAMGHNSADYIHVVAEAIKLALADRERYYGDPAFVDVPLERLLSDAYNAERRSMIRPDEAWPEMPPAGDFGNDPGPAWQTTSRTATAGESPPMPGDTSYVCVIDGDGNVFSSNPSDVTWESPVVPGTGLCPSARGSQSWAVPGHASALAPGKRPRLTPEPGARHARRQAGHAAWHAWRRHAVPGPVAGSVEHGAVQHGPAGRHRGAPFHDLQPAGHVRAAHRLSRPVDHGRPDRRENRRRARGQGPYGRTPRRHDVEDRRRLPGRQGRRDRRDARRRRPAPTRPAPWGGSWPER